jgi:hypothetical protein
LSIHAAVRHALTAAGGTWVNPAREPKTNVNAQFSFQRRLNATAWRAMKTQPGL